MLDLLPDRDCDLCPRLKGFIDKNRDIYPNEYNAPVPSFGLIDSELLIVGLAPGLKGANFTGRPFTGDYAGDLLYATLLKYGFAKGAYRGHKGDSLELINARITNAVRCVPPENKPTGAEIKTCLQFLEQEIGGMTKLKVIISLGLVSHNAVLKAFGHKQSAYKFIHNTCHDINGEIKLINSYHCSRYNTNTGRLTTKMFEDVFDNVKTLIR